MAQAAEFQGFPEETLDFYRELSANNDKLWFEEHRGEFERNALDPARLLVNALGEELRKIAPGIHADPRVNKSLFKIHRDTRFGHDKTPFKTHLALWFWEGSAPRMECSGFYFHVEPGRVLLGTGLYQFPPYLMEEYRRSVVDPKQGKSLVKAIKAVTKEEGVELGGKHYKRTPRGFDPDHENAEYLLYDGIYVGLEIMPPPPEIHSPKLVKYLFDRYKKMLPFHQWLLAMTERARKKL